MTFHKFFQKLLLARQIKFDKGSIELLNQKITIFPVSVFSTIVENNPAAIVDVYTSTKQSAKLFASHITEKYKFSGRELKDWLIDIIAFAGWGEAEFTQYDNKNYRAIVRLRNSTVGAIAKKKKPIDHAVRGFFAGGGTISMEKDLDCIETKCIAEGDKICEFILADKKTLKKEHPDYFKEQLGWLDGK